MGDVPGSLLHTGKELALHPDERTDPSRSVDEEGREWVPRSLRLILAHEGCMLHVCQGMKQRKKMKRLGVNFGVRGVFLSLSHVQHLSSFVHSPLGNPR